MEQQKPQVRANGLIQVSASKLIENLKDENNRASIQLKNRIPRFDIPRSDFMEMLKMQGSILMKKSGENTEFQYNSNASAVADQLYLYTIGSLEFPGSPDKGIALIGCMGCGKTVIMSAYINLINSILESKGDDGCRLFPDCPIYNFKTSLEIYRQYDQGDFGSSMQRMLLIDEVGRESKRSKSFGHEVYPITEVLHERHRRGLLTHIVANFTLKDLSSPEMYGPVIGDRMKQMFNFIVMGGGSLRR